MRWGEQLERGYTTLIAARVYGVPVRWTEREFIGANTDTAPAPTTNITTSPSLVITESSVIEWNLDRSTGIAAGRAVDIVLDLDAMDATTATLFTRPTLRSRVTVDLTDPAGTTLTVDDTTGWPSSGLLYLGQEAMTYSGTTATTFTGLGRGIAGDPQYHISNGASGYTFAADVPIYWRGRYVELWEYLVAPDGRIVAESYEDADYAGVIWRGFIDAKPEVKSRLVTLRCLPLERRFDDELGTSATAQVGGPWYSRGPLGVYITESDRLIIVREANGESVQVPFFGPTGTVSLARWAQQALADAATVFGGTFDGGWAPYQRTYDGGDGVTWFAVGVPDGYRVESRAWFIGDMFRSFDYSEGSPIEQYRGRLQPPDIQGGWMYIEVGLDVVGRPDAWPPDGYGILEAGGLSELIAWDFVDATLLDEGYVVIRLSQRGIAGTRRINPFSTTETVKLTSLAGRIGSAEEIIRTLATSSGTGARGVYDTLPAGYGLAMRDAWLDVTSYPLTGLVVDAIAEAGSTTQELIGGWLALWQMCLVQVRNGADMVVRAVSTSVLDAANATPLAAEGIILGSVSALSPMESPNAVIVQRGIRDQERALTLRDVPRVQAEGERPMEIRAPGATAAMVVGAASNILRLSDGMQAVEFGVRPSFAQGVGDIVRLTAEHPEAYDWATGTASTNEVALVSGYRRSLYTGETWRTVLIPGQAAALRGLCPSAEFLTRPSTTTATISAEDVVGFRLGSALLCYVAGSEDTLSTTRTVAGLAEAAGVWTVTFSATLSTSDYPAGAWMTYAPFGSDTEQDRHLYYDEGVFG